MSTGLNDTNRCQWCNMFHQSVCPKVKAIEYRDDGRVKRVEFFAPIDYPALIVGDMHFGALGGSDG